MLRLLRNNKGQNTAEYALLIALVVAGIIAMQQYAQRAIQARVRDASVFMTNQTGNVAEFGQTAQYEPYYQQSNYQVVKDSAENERLSKGLVEADSNLQKNREGQQKTSYEGTTGVNTGL